MEEEWQPVILPAQDLHGREGGAADDPTGCRDLWVGRESDSEDTENPVRSPG